MAGRFPGPPAQLPPRVEESDRAGDSGGRVEGGGKPGGASGGQAFCREAGAAGGRLVLRLPPVRGPRPAGGFVPCLAAAAGGSAAVVAVFFTPLKGCRLGPVALRVAYPGRECPGVRKASLTPPWRAHRSPHCFPAVTFTPSL